MENKIFKVCKKMGLIDLYEKSTNSHKVMPYDKFVDTVVMPTYIDYDKAKIILDYINSGKSLILDLNNKKVLLIKDKPINYNNVFKGFMSKDLVEEVYVELVDDCTPSFLQHQQDLSQNDIDPNDPKGTIYF